MQYGACYIRVSTDDQTEFSPDAQLKALKKYAKSNDIILTKQYIFADEGISGKRADKRPAFMQMIAIAKSKPRPFDIILVHKFDRFARSREDSVVYKSLLKKECGIKVVSITESIEDDKFSVILEAMLEAMAEYYSLNLAEEVKKGMTEKATRGEYQTTPAFGYRLENKKLLIEPEEAKLVKFMFEQFASKNMGLRQLAVYLNDLGIRTKRGNLFENRTVEYMLYNPLYIGQVRWTPTGKTFRNYHNPDSIIADGQHEAIIDMDTWEEVQKALAIQKELYSKSEKPNAKIKTWLKGLVKCGACGSTLVWNKPYYLQCNSYAKGKCKVSHHVNAHVLEDIVLEQLKETYQGNINISIVPKTSEVDKSNEFELLKERLSKMELREKRIKEAYQDGIDTITEYKENKTKLGEERQILQNQLNAINDNLVGENEQGETIVKRMKDVYSLLTDENITLETKYKTAHFLINKVVFNKPEKLVTIEYK